MEKTFLEDYKEAEKEIDLRESWNVNHWCEELNLRAEELKEIVRVVGPAVHDIRVHLAKRQLSYGPVAY